MTTRNFQLQSYYYASLFPSTSSVFTEPWRIGARNLLSESKLILHKARGTFVADGLETQRLKSYRRMYRISSDHQFSILEPEEARCGNTKRIPKAFPRNFDARHGRIETGAVIKNRKGLSGVEGGKGICYQWKEKGQCSHGDRCSFHHKTPRSCAKTRTHCCHTF